MDDARRRYLLDQHFGGALTRDEALELSQLLVADEAARRQFWQAADFDYLIKSAVESDRALLAEVAPVRRVWRTVQYVLANYTALSLIAASLFVGALLIGLSMWTIPLWRATFSDPLVASRAAQGDLLAARLTRLQQIVWEADQPAMPLGSRLLVGQRLRLRHGLAEVTHDDGAKVVLEGPCDYVVESRSAGRLHAGGLVATVPERGIGFQVETTAATITDLSTQFAVTVADPRSIAVHVISGRVRAEPKLGARQVVELVAGQSLHFNGQWHTVATLAAQATRYKLLLRDMEEPWTTPLLRVDFQSTTGGRLQAGFSPFTELDAASGKTFDSEQGPLHVNIAGQDTLKQGFFTRQQLTGGGGLTLAELHDDFAFHNAGGTLTVSIAGVEPQREYDLRVYCWDNYNYQDHHDRRLGQRYHTNLVVPHGETAGRTAATTFDAAAPPASDQQHAARLRVRSTTNVLTIAIQPRGDSLTRLNGLELFAAPQGESAALAPAP